MRPYTCTYIVTGVMQLYTVTDADHNCMTCATQTTAQLPALRALVVFRAASTKSCEQQGATLRQSTACSGETWSCSSSR